MIDDIYEKLVISSVFGIIIGRCIIFFADAFLQPSNLPPMIYMIVVSFGILLVILGIVIILTVLIETY